VQTVLDELEAWGSLNVSNPVPDGKRVHFSYSREDAELLNLAINMAQRAGYTTTIALWGQGEGWFDAWKKQLFEADGVIVLFTKGDEGRQVLGNKGMGYQEKLTQRFSEQGENAALYKEAMAIREKVKMTAGVFFVYAIDGRAFTPEQMRVNLEDKAPSYGNSAEWASFIDTLSVHRSAVYQEL
jgi:hypothetical protein